MKTAINKIWKPSGRINKKFTEATSTLELYPEDRIGFIIQKGGKMSFQKRVCREAGMEVFIPFLT